MCSSDLGPQVLLGAVGHDLAVDDVADAGEQHDEQELLHVGLGGLEPPTSSLSGKRSNQAEL